MRECSKSNNIEGVNNYVKSLLVSPEFLVLGYESIKSQLGVYFLIGSALFSNKPCIFMALS